MLKVREHQLDQRYASAEPLIPLEQQPFHTELERRADLWRHTPLGQVVGDSPQDTLLNFYAVMADVGQLIEDVEASHLNDRGLFWNRQARAEMAEVEVLFDAAVASLDGSPFSRSACAPTSRTKRRFSSSTFSISSSTAAGR